MGNSENNIVVKKSGTVTVDVFKSNDGSTSFCVEPNNDNVTNISEIIEDTLKLY